MPNGARATYTLTFNADTSQARKELEKLKQSLSNATSTFGIGQDLDADFQKAIADAQKLQGIIEKSTTASGDFNLSKFERALSKSGMTIDQVHKQLKKIGAEDAFTRLASQINNASSSVKILSGGLEKFYNGLKNTFMWTVQSNAIHAVQRALSSAFNYAQQLNKGLTDIAIVSDLDTKQLTAFAKTANQMAKDLSASTSDVVSGALIYYQAGLSDEEVIKRTETTIKLAQTSGESAEQISSYMTAIWNNFYDGSKSVEYYADAISYLGAVTAASNADIAEGMQAFSAVADTVGLSFEYGAAALTTLRDVTQQSASTIGNSLKTIFARLSSLKMGEDLEDGVDLTKYTKALEAVGVDVLTANGELRDMDNILDSLASKWDSISDAEKVALAQTVGGVRQYNNLISLMDNYERFQKLVSGAKDSDGYLQRQADIYADSWEGAKNRFKAAWQEIYDQIIDDKFLIKLTNFATFLTNTLSNIIKGMGGLPGVISVLVMELSSLGSFSNDLKNTADAILEIKNALTGLQKERNENLQVDTLQSKIDGLVKEGKDFSPTVDQYAEIYQKIQDYRDAVNKGDKETAGILGAELLRQKAIIEEKIKLEEKNTELKEKQVELEKQISELEAGIDKYNKLDKTKKGFDSADPATQFLMVESMLKNPENFGLPKDKRSSVFKTLKREKDYLFMHSDNPAAAASHSQKISESLQNTLNLQADALRNIGSAQKENNNLKEESLDTTQKINNAEETNNDKLKEAKKHLEDIKKQQEDIKKENKNADTNFTPKNNGENPNKKEWEEGVSGAVRAVSSITAMSSSMQGLWNTAKEGKLSIGSLAGSFGTIWRSSIMATKGLNTLGDSLVKGAESSKMFGGIMSKVGGILGGAGPFSVLGYVAALTVALGALKWALDKAYESSPEGKLEAANKALQEQEQLVNQLTTKYGNTISTIEKLKDVENTFKDLEIGTVQWTEALQQNNEAVLDLLDSYDLLNSNNYEYLVKNGEKTGVLKITKDAFEEIEKRAQAQLTTARLGTYALKNIRDEAELLIKRKDLTQLGINQQNKYGYNTNLENTNSNLKDFNSNGKSLNSIVDTILKDYEGSLRDFLDSQQNQNEYGDWIDLINESEELQSGINNQIAALNKNTAAIEARNQQIGQTLAATANVPEWARGILADAYTEENGTYNFQDQYNEVKNDLNTKSGYWLSKGNEEYLKQLGIEWRATDSKFYNDQGETLDDEAVRRALANQIVSVKLTDAKVLEDILYKKDENGEFKLDDDGNKIYTDKAQAAYDKYQREAEERAEQEGYLNTLKTAKELGLDTEEFEKYITYLQEVNDKLKDHKDIAAEVALANMRINRGVETLSENIDDWKKEIELATDAEYDWQKDGYKYMDAMEGIREALSDIANIDLTDLDFDFIEDHLEEIEAAATGDEKAVNKLIKLIAVDFIDALDGLDEKNTFTDLQQQLVDLINKTDFDDIVIGTRLNTGPFNELLQQMVANGEIAADNINEFLARIGYSPIVEYKEIPIDDTHVTADEAHGTYTVHDDEGNEYTLESSAVVSNTAGEKGMLRIPIIKGSNNGNSFTLATSDTMPQAFSSSVFTGGTGRNVSGSNRHGGSGGGGGHGHHRTPKAKDEDRYHEINQKLKQTEHELNKVNTLKDRSYGRGRLNAMDEEIKLLEREAEQYKELYREAEHWFALDKSALVGFGAKFNDDGTIANYQAWQASWIDRYNNESISEEEFSAWQKAVSKYEDSLQHLNEAEEKYIQKMNQIYDEHLEQVVYRVEYLNELIELSTDYLDYLIEKLDEDMYDTAETVAKMGEKASNILEQVNNIQQGIFDALTDKNNHPKLNAHQEIISEYLKGERDLQDVLNNIGQLTDKEQEQLREWMGQLIDYNKELRKTQKEAYDKIIESIEEFNDKMERQQDIVNDTAGVMEHYANIIDIIGKDTLGISDAMMNALNDLQVTAAQSNLTIALTALNENRDALAKIQKDLAEARKQQAETDDELRKRALENDIKYLEEAMEQQEDIVRDLAEEWASAYEDALKSAQDAFTNGVKLATEAFDKAVSGSIGSLDKLQDFYDKQTTLQDIFLPDYERIHDLSKLARDINNAINTTDNLKGKERLRNLQNEILEAQREGTELSKYDMEFMQKRFELEQAQIAMEEQRNAKNLVRMTRDNEGNWSYTYTQNPEDVAKAQQEFEDKLYDLEKLNQDRVKETQQLMLNAMEKFRDEIADADMNDQEKTQALLDYWRQLQEEYGNLTDTALKDGKWITDTYDVSNHELTDSFEETLLSLGTGYQTLEDFMNDFRSASATMGDDVAAQYQKWGDYVKAITEAAGINFDNFAQRVADDMDLVIAAMIGEDGNGGAVGVAKQLADEMGISVDDILKELEGWWNGPEGRSVLMEAEIEENEKTYEQLERLIANADQIPVELPKISQAIQKIASGGGHECGCGATCTTTCWTDCGSNCASYTRTSSPSSPSDRRGSSGHHVTVSFDDGSYLDTHVANGKRLGTVVRGDTGMYTGEWGPEGKLAILDEKELVLNKEDTANMLATVGFVRDLVEMIGVNATSAGGIGDLLLGGIGSGGNYLDQNVTIHAEFPNATNHSEIEEAFQNLIGLAGQYAGRKQ